MSRQPTDSAFDLVVVGAALTGSAMACSLAAHDSELRIAVLEAGGDPGRFSGENFDPRVVALTRTSQGLLEEVGAWPAIVAERACAYTDMEVWDAEGTGRIHFDCREVQQPNLGHIVENSVATRALLQRLTAYSNISLLRPARVEGLRRAGENTCLQLQDGGRILAPLVIAADGANSPLRQLAELSTREWDYGHEALVTTVRSEQPHRYTAWQRFLDTGPLAFLPLQEGGDADSSAHFSSIVWSCVPALANELMSLSDVDFASRLGSALEYRLGAVTGVAKRFSFPLRQRHALQYYAQGLALVGDAAHTIHPLAGQGANLGFLDVLALRDEILRARRRGVSLADLSILKRYQRVRRGPNLAMMGLMEGFKQVFGVDQLPLRWARNEGMRRLDTLTPLKSAVIRQAMGL